MATALRGRLCIATDGAQERALTDRAYESDSVRGFDS
jgi:hypothetical protein